MKMQNRNRASLLAIAGVYVLYLAYEMVKDQVNGKSTMALWLCIVAVAFFGIAGIAVLIYAWKIYRTKDKDDQEEDSPENQNALK